MKVHIWYSFDNYAEKFDRKDNCEAWLKWQPIEGESEMLIGRGDTFEKAKEQAIALFKLLPPSEELEL